MRNTLINLSRISVALLVAGAAQAEVPYYNPANAAGSNGMTTGYDLYQTIGCPGRGILEAPCAEPVVAKAVEAALDGDKDGVLDAADKCPATPAGDRVDSVGCTLLNTIVLKGVNFDNNADVLRADAIAALDEALLMLKRYPGLKVEVAGHTDNLSDDVYNQQLSERRAKAVMGYFVGKGVQADALSAKGYGKASPVADNASEEGRATNRRVELRILN